MEQIGTDYIFNKATLKLLKLMWKILQSILNGYRKL